MLEEIYKKLKIFPEMQADLAAGRHIALNGGVPYQTEHLLAGLGDGFDFKVIVTFDEHRAMEIMENYMAMDRRVAYYPPRDPMFYKADIRGNYLSEQRMEVVRNVFEGNAMTITTCPDAFADRLVSFESIRERMITIKAGDEIDERELAEKLVDLGYSNETQVASRGEFSIRGNIIDVYPYTAETPYRLDLWGESVEDIKIFDVANQRSIESVGEVMIFPGGDGENRIGDSEFLSYFDPKKTLLIFDEPARLFEETDPPRAETFPIVYLSTLGNSSSKCPAEKTYTVNTRNIPSYNGRTEDLFADLKKYKSKKWDVTLCAANETRAERLRSELLENDTTSNVIVCGLRGGFEYPDLKLALISEVDIFGQRRIRKKTKKRYTGDPIKDFTDLTIGDYVVHEQHGIGEYCGIERITVDGSEKDFMKIRYANNANLYVLATQFDRVQKYSGAEGATPKINRLGGKEWTNTKARVRAAVKDIAAELVRLYAERQVKKGFEYSPDTPWQKEFEDSFEFEETDDQLRAIEAVKSDMESGKIMDRLICGDVGFGKTEVAIRAAFKAVQDGKQVAFLAPTTILVKQHFDTICQRMANYPVKVRMLSRFVTGAAQKKALDDIRTGAADIVVGTHRLLSKDVKFKDLGLLIIDEEQRFGVAHKEKIKEIRNDVDVLTLSATPIPRTLHMSLTGIRDMSLLTEPPIDRIPIQTYVMEYSDEAVREAIIREAARGGQIYYVYNRIDNIEQVAARIQNLAPSLIVRFAHGRMSSRELESIMEDFVNQEIDILVSTTIIESGLDISNVNTIIIQDADNYGLSQLYQLRGRVGRSNRTAYAFLMYRQDKLIREVAEKRLTAIREFSDLGSGVKIAMRDLEIRGAGNVLGAEQSGHMEAVGYELYCKMLNEAVLLLKGGDVAADYDTTIDLSIDGYIPSTYIVNTNEKLNMYKKISGIVDMENVNDIRSELEDRFGEIPRVTENLLTIALIKAKAHERYITEITGSKSEYKISMFKNANIDTYKIYPFMKSYNGQVRFVTDGLYFVYKPSKAPSTMDAMRDLLLDFFDKMEDLIDKGNPDEPEQI